jgi:hypothetical protein
MPKPKLAFVLIEISRSFAYSPLVKPELGGGDEYELPPASGKRDLEFPRDRRRDALIASTTPNSRH